MSETIGVGSQELPQALMKKYLERHEEVVKALGPDPDEKAVCTIKEAENIFFNTDGKHPDIGQRCTDAILVLNGGEEKIN